MKFEVALLLFIGLVVVEVRSAEPAEVTPDQSSTNSAGDVVPKTERLIQAPPPPGRAGDSEYLIQGYPATLRGSGNSDSLKNGYPPSPPRGYGDSDYPNNEYPDFPPRGYGDRDFQIKGYPASPSRGSGVQVDGPSSQSSGYPTLGSPTINDILSILNPTGGGYSSGVNLEESLKKGLVPSLLAGVVKLLGSLLTGVFESLSGLRGLIPQLLGTLIGQLRNLLESLLGGLLGGVVNGVKDGMLDSETIQLLSNSLVSQLKKDLYIRMGVPTGGTSTSRRHVWPYQQQSHRSGV